jgi:hypothetical protein
MLGPSCDFWVCWHTLLVRTSSPKASFSVIPTYQNSGLWTHQPEKCQSKDFWPVVGLWKALLTLLLHHFAMLQASFCNFHNQFERPKIKLHLTKQNVPLMLRCNFSFLKGVSIHERWNCTKKTFRCLPMMGKACPCRHATCLGPQHSGYHPQGHAFPYMFPYAFTFLSNEWGLLDRHLGKG